MLTIDTPLADRPRHQASCGLYHDCRGQDCANGLILANDPNATQDGEKPWLISWPMSDQDILDADARRVAAEAEAAAAAAEAEAKAAARQALLDRLGITAEEAQLLLGQ